MKNLRRTCDNTKCDKLYRYQRATSEYCSTACRVVVSRERKAAEDKAESDARLAELREQARQIARQIAAKTARAERAAAPEPEAKPKPEQRKRKPISRLFPEPAPPVAVVTIHNIPRRFPGTPLPRRS